MANPQTTDENRRAVYQELCKKYKEIDDFRLKLLGLLPLATSGIFLLLKPGTSSDISPLTFLPVGLFGFVSTLGLLCYEVRGMQYCMALIRTGRDIEDELHIEGSFKSRPSTRVSGFIGARTAAGVIYPGVLAAWIYLAVSAFATGSNSWIAWLASIVTFFSGMAILSSLDLEGQKLVLKCKTCKATLAAEDDKKLTKQLRKN